jgi:outer membrane protein OmpA-like peptidoglycan-associated protein
MKCRVWKVVFATIFIGVFYPGLAQKNYYVVVGAFSTEGNAKELKAHLPNTSADTAYAMANDQDNLVHLYVLRTADQDEAASKAMQLQKGIEEMDNGGPYEAVTINSLLEQKSVTIKNAIETHGGADAEDVTSDASESKGSSSSAENPMAGIAPATPAGRMFKFMITDPNGVNIPGAVHVVDFQNEIDLASYKTSAYTSILNPGRDHDVSVVCGIFGYKQSEKYLDYSHPDNIEGSYRDVSGAWVIPYDLERLEKGDVSVMYNVSFHQNADVMLPPSKADLDELVKMMMENADYKIVIHGHCNGKNDRVITAMGSDHSYFETKGSSEFFGSAKELAQLRANAIKQYLLEYGISEKRIKTYAWGGRYMLVEPDHRFSNLNDRIEIEILKD